MFMQRRRQPKGSPCGKGGQFASGNRPDEIATKLQLRETHTAFKNSGLILMSRLGRKYLSLKQKVLRYKKQRRIRKAKLYRVGEKTEFKHEGYDSVSGERFDITVGSWPDGAYTKWLRRELMKRKKAKATDDENNGQGFTGVMYYRTQGCDHIDGGQYKVSTTSHGGDRFANWVKALVEERERESIKRFEEKAEY